MQVVPGNMLINDFRQSEDGKSLIVADGPFYSALPPKFWEKRLKDGHYIHHHWNGGRPGRGTMTDKKRRMLYRIVLADGNPTWDNVEHFLAFTDSLWQCESDAEIRSLMCGKWCKSCNHKTQDDIEEDALTMSAQGYKH